jgi:hypothetical protein
MNVSSDVIQDLSGKEIKNLALDFCEETNCHPSL